MQSARAWESTLGEIELAVGNCLQALDRYEASFRKAYAENGGNPESLRLHVPGDPLDESWDRPLGEAERSAKAVEELLAEQEIVWTHWQELVARWRHSLEHPPELEPEFAHAFLRSDPPGRRAIEPVRRP